MAESNLVYSTGTTTGVVDVEGDFVEEADLDICRQCGVGTIIRFEIWETCSNDACSYDAKVECCHSCAGLE